MENVLTAFIVIFVILFAVLSLSQAFITTQDMLAASSLEMEARQNDQAETHIQVVETYTTEAGSLVSLVLHNTGSTKLADFSRWDVIVQYDDGSGSESYHMVWLPYQADGLNDNTWTVSGLYLNDARDRAEAYEPGLFNPGETLWLQAKLFPPAAPGSAILTMFSVSNGSSASEVFTANVPPQVIQNAPLTIASGDEGTITDTLLVAADDDDPAADLVYTVTTPPAQGDLSLSDTFTQRDITSGSLLYTHTGSGSDTFQFTVTDGKDTSPAYTFTINISEPPTLSVNLPIVVANGGMGWFGSAVLQITDPDDDPANLVYTVTVPPASGTLSLGSTFTQADINNGSLLYTHTGSILGLGSTSDVFMFTVSDGETTIGPFTFTFTLY